MAGKGDNILKSIVERIERLTEERTGISDDINVVYAEAKVHGLDVKTVREMIRLRKMDPDALKERMALIEEYGNTLGMDLL
jgi:uncharacterized protein (UPF0335 family)